MKAAPRLPLFHIPQKEAKAAFERKDSVHESEWNRSPTSHSHLKGLKTVSTPVTAESSRMILTPYSLLGFNQSFRQADRFDISYCQGRVNKSIKTSFHTRTTGG